MAVSRSWSSDTTSSPRQKYFTLVEANRALPLVRRVVEDVVRMHERATALHVQLENRLPATKRDEIHSALERAVDRLGDLMEELKAIGCDIKDYRIGLIDFTARHAGRDICLCWKLGETSVGHWHELHDGYGGRQPVVMLGV